MPYDGPNLYPLGVVMQLLTDGVLEAQDCESGVRATRSVDPKSLKKSAMTFQACVVKAASKHLVVLFGIYEKPDNVKYEDREFIVVNRQKNEGSGAKM